MREFHFNMDWFFATGARDRMEAVRDLVIGDLEVTPPDEWGAVMRRYSNAYHVRLGLFDDDADWIIGEVLRLPEEVRERIINRTPFGRPRRNPSDSRPPPGPPPPPELSGESKETSGRRRWPRFPLRALMRTTDPTHYWLLTSASLDNPLAGEPMRVVLVARSNTISAGGLIFDPKPWIALAIGVVLFSLLFWLPLVRGITRTIGKMVNTTRQIAAGRFDVRVNLRRRDELGSLAESIDQMATRLDGLVKGQKRFLGDIAHELCSPLARLQLALSILEERGQGGQTKLIESAREKAEQIAALVGELLSFSKASFGAASVKLSPVNLLAVVEEAVRREATDEVRVEVKVDPALRATGDFELLVRALANLIRNAVHHAGRENRIVTSAVGAGDEVMVRVADEGPGVPAEDLPKIFDAFYRVDPSRTRDTGGTGLGLAIVKTCVDTCGGSVTACNRQPHGLEVQITLRAEVPELSDVRPELVGPGPAG